MDNPKDAKPLEMPPVLAHVQAAVDKLAACETIKAAIEAVKRDDEKTLADQFPAPNGSSGRKNRRWNPLPCGDPIEKSRS